MPDPLSRVYVPAVIPLNTAVLDSRGTWLHPSGLIVNHRRTADSGSQGRLVYLAHLYDLDEIVQLSKYRDSSRSLVPPSSLAQLELVDLLNYGPVDSRMQYRARLGQAIREERDPRRMTSLNMELAIWHVLDQADMTRYLSYDLGPLPMLLEDKHRHWLWHEMPNPRRRPATNWHGQKGVPIYKLLWPYVYPDEPLPVLSVKRAVKRAGVCNDIEFRRCVNPWHMETVEPWTWLPGGKRGRHTDFKTGRSLAWTAEHIKTVDGVELLHCPACNAVAAHKYQLQVEEGLTFGTMRCQPCIERWKMANGYRKVRAGRKPVPDSEKPIEVLEAELAEAADKNERWWPKEWDDPNYHGPDNPA